jgi:hypothetical protein
MKHHLLILSFLGSIVSAAGTGVHAEGIRDTARRLSKDSDALFEMYQTHKELRESGVLSPLQELLDNVLQTAEDARDSGSQSAPKHILTILTDDQGYADIGYNDPTFVTPVVDAIAKRGVKLTSFYVQNTCSPTRASLLTGNYFCKMTLLMIILHMHIIMHKRLK